MVSRHEIRTSAQRLEGTDGFVHDLICRRSWPGRGSCPCRHSPGGQAECWPGVMTTQQVDILQKCRYCVDIVQILCRYCRLYHIDLWTYRIGSNIVGHNLQKCDKLLIITFLLILALTFTRGMSVSHVQCSSILVRQCGYQPRVRRLILHWLAYTLKATDVITAGKL